MCLGIVWFVGKLSRRRKLAERAEPGRQDRRPKRRRRKRERGGDGECEGDAIRPGNAGGRQAAGESGNWYSGRTETGRMETEEELPVEEYRPPSIVTVSDIHYFASSMTDYGEAF